MDWHASADDNITFQGDYYNGYDGDEAVFATFMPPDFTALEHDITHVQGDNILLNWRRVLGEQSDWTALVYFDQTERHWTHYGFGENQNTFNFDYQYRCPLGSRNELICGGGYRLVQCDTYSVQPGRLPWSPGSPDNIYSCFVQDQFTVQRRLPFPDGGLEIRARRFHGLRVGAVDPAADDARTRNIPFGHRCPGRSASRRSARRTCRPCPRPTPAKGFPSTPSFCGNPNLLSEEMIAYEAGVRGQPTEKLSWDLAVFSNNYDRLTMPVPGHGERPQMLGPIVVSPLTVENANKADTYGFELAANYKVNPAWQLRLSYSSLVMHVAAPGNTGRPAVGRRAPRNLVYAAIVLRPGASLGTGPDRPLLRRACHPSGSPSISSATSAWPGIPTRTWNWRSSDATCVTANSTSSATITSWAPSRRKFARRSMARLPCGT